MRPMYPPSDESDVARHAGRATDGAVIYVLWAFILVDGTMRLVAKDDVPFGIVQISTVVAVVAVRLMRGSQIARWVARIALGTVMVASGVAEIYSGHSVRGACILAILALLVAVVFNRERRTKTEQLVP